MKRLLLLLCVLWAYLTLNAESVSKSDALKKAQSFMPGRHFVESKSVASARAKESGKPDAFYVFNADNNGGFVIVSGDDRTEAILGYAEQGRLSEEDMPDNLRYWLECYAEQISNLGNGKVSSTRGTRTARANVSPLITTKWNQDEPFNLMCPDGNGRDYYESGYNHDNRCATGCVATAMAQVMNYHKWPKTCQGIDAYTNGFSLKALPATTFEWTKMKKTYTSKSTGESAEAVAKLMRYCGQAVEMYYGIGGSSAGIIPYDMVTNFGYGKNARQVNRFLFSSSEWEQMIYKEVYEGRPVIYGGQGSTGGHQFICDGYENGYFHINWGWGGMSDGFFQLSLANPDDYGIGGGTSKDGYSWEQNAIIGLKPDNGEAEQPYIYSYINDQPGWVKEYSRSSVDKDFANVSLPGEIFMNYDYAEDMIWPDYEFECGWGVYEDGSLTKVIGISNMKLSYDVNWGLNEPLASFGNGMADGRYMLSQVYRPKGSDEWMPCETCTYRMSYIIATISGKKLTLKVAAEEDYTNKITINSINYSVSSFEVGRPVEATVNLTNNGDSFQELICLKYGNQMTMVCGSLEPGKTGTVKLHLLPKVSGEIPVKISTDPSVSNVVWSGTITVATASAQYLSATVTTPGLVGETLTGTTLKVNANVKNVGTNTYENVIQLCLYENTEDPSSQLFGGPLVTTKSMMATIKPGETKEVLFSIEELNPDIQYFFFISYFSQGVMYFEIPGVGYPFFPTAQAVIPGDVDGDGDVDVDDINTVVQYIFAGEYIEKADVNNDGKVDAADIVEIVKVIKKK